MATGILLNDVFPGGEGKDGVVYVAEVVTIGYTNELVLSPCHHSLNSSSNAVL